ncbi:MAG: Ig domain-containing protein [Lachnospiraceae bacterium]|nr:Ig domain-containing protein [Lachnospiraceae bacterium]
MKKLKLLFMTLIGCILILSIPKNSAKAIENRMPIALDDTWVNDSVTDDVRFYEFTIPSSGTVTCTFQSYSSFGSLCLEDKDLISTFLKIKTYYGSLVSPESVMNSAILEQGTYVLKVCDLSENNWTGDYRLKLSFTPANNNEAEPNDTFETAMELKENQQIRGLISDCETNDYFKITLDQPQQIHMIYRFDSKFSWSLWNADFLPVYESYTEEGSNEWKDSLDAGTYYIKINGDDYSGTYNLKWFIETPVSTVKLDKTTLQLAKGKQYIFSTTVGPENATNKSLKWTSTNPSVASINTSGKLTAKCPGATTITVTSKDGTEISASCLVIVLPQKASISSSTANGRKISLQLQKQKGVSGYQVICSTNKNFKNQSTYNTSSTKLVTKKLQKKKKYYFKARAYYTYKGKKYYGAWSDMKSIRTRK